MKRKGNSSLSIPIYAFYFYYIFSQKKRWSDRDKSQRVLCFLWLQEHLQLINLDAVSDFGIWLWTVHDFYCANNPFPVAGLGHLVENCLFISEKELPVSNHSRTRHKTDIPSGCFLISDMKVAVRKNGTLSLSEQVQSRSSLDVLTQLQEKKRM